MNEYIMIYYDILISNIKIICSLLLPLSLWIAFFYEYYKAKLKLNVFEFFPKCYLWREILKNLYFRTFFVVLIWSCYDQNTIEEPQLSKIFTLNIKYFWDNGVLWLHGFIMHEDLENASFVIKGIIYSKS